MRFSFVLIALVATTSAIPANHHGRHWINNAPNNVAAAPEVDKGHVHGGSKGNGRAGNGGGNQGINTNAGNAAHSPAQTAAPPAAITTAAAIPNTGSSGNSNGAINPSFVPDFGQQAGVNPNGQGSCEAISGKLIPCQCPPSRAAFIEKLQEFVNAGTFPNGLKAPFPTSSSNQDALTRIDTIISTLQNFDGKAGVGCPAASAPAFSAEQSRLIALIT